MGIDENVSNRNFQGYSHRLSTYLYDPHVAVCVCATDTDKNIFCNGNSNPILFFILVKTTIFYIQFKPLIKDGYLS